MVYRKWKENYQEGEEKASSHVETVHMVRS